MDDGELYGTPEAMKWSLDLIEKLEPVSGWKLKWTKMSVHAPDSVTARTCRELLPNNIEIIKNQGMDFVYLKKTNWHG